jgi:2-polyprenyl-3-methyl-5-hydroxy-6-metoxy-1,4-benzoquinol methylase
MDDRLIEVPCDLCGSRRAVPFLSSVDRNWSIHSNCPQVPPLPDLWRTVRCADCDLIYLSPRPRREALGAYYPQSYYAYATETAAPRRNSWRSALKRFARRHRSLTEALRRTRFADVITDPVMEVTGWIAPGRVLDIGCGSGGDLDALAALGWTTFGIDISERAVNVATRKGHRVWCGDVTELHLSERDMDVVLMSHSLEHTESPRRTLEAVRQLLRPGGIAVVEVPNIGSCWSAVFRERSWVVDLPRHLYHFTGKTLDRALRAAGFHVRSLRPQMSPRFLLRSVTLSLLDWPEPLLHIDGTGPALRELPETTEWLHALKPFCQALEHMGQGSNLVAVAERPA